MSRARKPFGPNYQKGWQAAEADLKSFGLDHVCNFALAAQSFDALGWFSVGYRSRANLATERLST